MDETIKKILSLIGKDKELTGAFDKGGFLNLSGLCDEQKGYIAAALSLRVGKKPVIVVPDIARAKVMKGSIEAFVDGDVLILTPSELNLVNAVASSRDSEMDRVGVLARVLDDRYGALLICAGTLINKLPAASEFRKRITGLKLGDEIDPSELAMRLASLGYKRTAGVEAKGEFAARGDILDVYPTDGSDPVRISFFDDEIDRITLFDKEDQRSKDSLKEVSIPPASEIIIAENKRKEVADRIAETVKDYVDGINNPSKHRKEIELITRTSQDDIGRVKEGISLSAPAKWLNLIISEAYSVLDYIDPKKDLFIMDEMTDAVSRLRAYGAEYTIRCRESFEKGIAPKSSMAALHDTNLILKQIDDMPGGISFSVLGNSGFPKANKAAVRGFPQAAYRGRDRELADLIKESKKSKEQDLYIILPEGKREESFLERMKEQEVFPEVIPGILARGFTYPAIDLSLLGEQDIFGTDKITAPKKKNGNRISYFGDVNPGDYVVHDEHGIGRYEGLFNVKVGNTSKDYMKITYAKDETLYILPEDVDCLSKYMGPGGKPPKLSPLGGDSWKKSVSRARESAKVIAYDLLKLYAARSANKGFAALPDDETQKQFEEQFPYLETEDQMRAIREIKQDMESEHPMDRLLCGDVGFGKTEVAFRALVKCVLSGRQAFMLAPTTLLAQQHYENFRKRLGDIPINVVLLSRFVNPAQLKTNLKAIRDGKADVIIGTHRILSDDVKAKNLGLLVVDEEQRFGVNHKEKIKALKTNIDVLTLSATPIPRTLHMSLSGIRDISVLDEPPINRRPVQTYVMAYDPDIIVQAAMREISRGGQIFYLYNRTEDIDKVTDRLRDMMPGARIIYAHGQMAEHQLEQIISDFAKGEYDILVCTTIIENGVDMANVNTMIVEDADRFGLSQLYQIKGRVGRSDRQAYAYITYEPDKVLKEDATKRLEALREFTELGSGVKIALRDLEVRGAGNLLGAEQHGQMDVIGYELYLRLLDEEVRKLKNEGDSILEESQTKAHVEVDFDSYIPTSYIDDQATRMLLYRKIGGIRCTKDYDDFYDEIEDRYGEPPKEINILTAAALIRNLSPTLGFEKVTVKATGVRFYFYPDRQIDMNALSSLMQEKDIAGRLRLNATGELYMAYKPATMQHDKTMNEIVKILTTIEKNKG